MQDSYAPAASVVSTEIQYSQYHPVQRYSTTRRFGWVKAVSGRRQAMFCLYGGVEGLRPRFVRVGLYGAQCLQDRALCLYER
eukprot:1851958-Rhodomonas_salina.1